MEIKTVDYYHPAMSELFTESLLNTGFAVVKNHPISQQLIFDTYKEWENFFASEEKTQYPYQDGAGFVSSLLSETAKGYDQKDLKEFYHYYEWGPFPKGLSSNTKVLFKELHTLAGTLLQWIEEKLPPEVQQHLSMPLSSMIQESKRNLLRILHYPPLTGNEQEGAVRAAAHGDINLITLLPAATASGLQVKDNEEVWHEVSCDPGSIVVNIGDMLEMATQGYFKSTTHRVVNPQGEAVKQSRFSMPFFLHPQCDVRLSSTHTADDFLKERLRELGLRQ